MPPKFSTTNGRVGRGGFYKRSSHDRNPGRFEPTQDRQAGDNPPMKREESTKLNNGDSTELDNLSHLVEKLYIELGLLKERLRVLEAIAFPTKDDTDQKKPDNSSTSKKPFFNKRRRVRKRSPPKQQPSTHDQPQASSQKIETAPIQTDSNNKVEQGRRNVDRNINRSRRNNRQMPVRPNDDSTTQAADPSSEERPEGEERKRIFRRKKNRFNRRGTFTNRRRVDSSERNSNDTSPQAGVDVNDPKPNKLVDGEIGDGGSLIDTEEFVQNIKRDFLHSDRELKSIYEELCTLGPTLIYEFFVSILEHVICDVTSCAELSETTSRIYLMLFKDNLSQHQESFVNALNSISNREDDLAIDAPRYMDSLGQFLAEILVRLFSKDQESYKQLLLACLDKYKPDSRADLLVSIMTAIDNISPKEKSSKDLWNRAGLNWETYVAKDNLAEFLANNSSIQFTASECTIEENSPPDNKSLSLRLERFADDITAMVERKKDSGELLDRWTKENGDFDIPDEVAYRGNLIYGIVRGCLVLLSPTCDGVRLDHELLLKYDSILSTQHDKQDEVALSALTLLTKLWYRHKCPKDMFINILSALHCTHKTTTNSSLRRWLEDKDLHSIPGIGAARLHCKRFIDEVTS